MNMCTITAVACRLSNTLRAFDTWSKRLVWVKHEKFQSATGIIYRKQQSIKSLRLNVVLRD